MVQGSYVLTLSPGTPVEAVHVIETKQENQWSYGSHEQWRGTVSRHTSKPASESDVDRAEGCAPPNQHPVASGRFWLAAGGPHT
jgi:hypothetical protein